MFGYVRPFKDELKVREFDQFKSCYCALCHTLKKQYGALASSILNYDFTFLAMLLWDEGTPVSYECARCIASPLQKRTYCTQSGALEKSAGYSVILAWWKLKDAIKDEPFLKSLASRFLSLFLRRPYKKAVRRFAAFDAVAKTQLEALGALETVNSDSLDACADRFAGITAAMAANAEADDISRPMAQLLYHTGRFIYIVDACDDLEEDLRKGRFNPIAKRFNTAGGGKLSDEARETLKTTIMHSCKLIATSFELLPKNPWNTILRNIIYLGMPDACVRVLNGTWHNRGGNSGKNKGNEQFL